jgi:hypothetical protein
MTKSEWAQVERNRLAHRQLPGVDWRGTESNPRPNHYPGCNWFSTNPVRRAFNASGPYRPHRGQVS